MAPVALIRIAAIVPVRRFLTRIGAPVDRLLARVHLPSNAFDDPEALIPYGVAAGFLEEAARADGVELLGTMIGQHTPIDGLGVFGRRIARAPALADALATACRIAPYYSGERLWLTSENGDVQLCHRFPKLLDDWNQQAEQYSLVCALRFLRSVAGPLWDPQAIHVPKGVPCSIADTPLLRGATVLFDQDAWSIRFSKSILRLPLPPTSTRRDTPFEWMQWVATAPARDLPGALGQVLVPLLRSGDADIEVVARWFAVSTRTLQRRLEDVGVSFADVLAKTRLRAAVRRLGDRTVRLSEIAVELGYSDPAHFSRAFRRWTGRPPRAFRQQRQGASVIPLRRSQESY